MKPIKMLVEPRPGHRVPEDQLGVLWHVGRGTHSQAYDLRVRHDDGDDRLTVRARVAPSIGSREH